jgi:hypothetical protein
MPKGLVLKYILLHLDKSKIQNNQFSLAYDFTVSFDSLIIYVQLQTVAKLRS